MKQTGYDRPLFVQPFDHRGSFTKSFFSFKGAPAIEPDKDQFVPVTAAKTLIYRGLLEAIEMGVPKDEVGILVDAQFGSHIIADAKTRGIPAAVCVEKSGQNVFDFEYGSRWEDHLRYLAPDIVKVLVRHHPEDDPLANREQLARLKLLSDYIHASNDHYLMFELLVPATTPAEEVLSHNPDGVFLSNGPGDPAETGKYAVPEIKKLVASGKPVFGICLGHQMLGIAVGGRTMKMHQGHHGANHPVKDHTTEKVEITSMNHGFAVDRASLPANVQETHVSLFDGSNCGLALKDAPVFSVQYHPEASPGPEDSHYLFRRFVNMMRVRRGEAPMPEHEAVRAEA